MQFSYLLHISGESAVLSFVNWLTLSGAEQSGLRGPSTENQEAKQAAILCIKVLNTGHDVSTLFLHVQHRGCTHDVTLQLHCH